jgi:hypothetical protein
MAVMTTRFVTSVELMVRVLRFSAYPFATIAHPISRADDDALCTMEPALRIRRAGCCSPEPPGYPPPRIAARTAGSLRSVRSGP